jgi:outer membrane murein-binding lipoprotein Lpp
MRKFTVAVATASLLVAGCGNPGEASKDEAAAPETTEDDDKGGDPGIKAK